MEKKATEGIRSQLFSSHESAILNSPQLEASAKVSKKTGKSSKLFNQLMGRLDSSKLAEFGLNRMVMDEVNDEINQQMRQNKTSYRADEQLSRTAQKLRIDTEGGIDLTLVHVDLNTHSTLKLRIHRVNEYLK